LKHSRIGCAFFFGVRAVLSAALAAVFLSQKQTDFLVCILSVPFLHPEVEQPLSISPNIHAGFNAIFT